MSEPEREPDFIGLTFTLRLRRLRFGRNVTGRQGAVLVTVMVLCTVAVAAGILAGIACLIAQAV